MSKERLKDDLCKFNTQKANGSDRFIDYFDRTKVNFESSFQGEGIGIDFNYAFQTRIAHQVISALQSQFIDAGRDLRELYLLDVGSRISDVLIFSNYFYTISAECRNISTFTGRWNDVPGLNLGFLNSEVQNLCKFIKPETVNILTCLHAMEHFGLGRYGDTIDYFGDQKALDIFSKVLCDNCFLLLSVPFTSHDSPRIEFNGQRVYNFKTIDSMLDNSGFEITERWFIFPGCIRTRSGKFLHRVTKNTEVVESMDNCKETREYPGVYFTLSQKREINK